MSLGLLGVGYAAWTDTVTISGTVNTGTVELDVDDYSHTIVWKTDNVSNDCLFIAHYTDTELAADPTLDDPPADVVDAFPNGPYPPGTAGIDPVSSAHAVTNGDNAVLVTIDNAFPLGDGVIAADFILHYNGTIPVKVNGATINVTSGNIDPADVVIAMYKWNTVTSAWDPISLLGEQLHKSNLIKVVISVDLFEQEAADQGLTGTIGGSIDVIQWNEY